MAEIPGAYVLAILDSSKDAIVMRDRMGIKPGVLGKKGKGACMASEDVALRKNGASIIEDLRPGAIYYISAQGRWTKEEVVDPDWHTCFFEKDYIGDQDTVFDGVSVRTVRRFLGEELAREYGHLSADYVTFIPRCPKIAALAFAANTGNPFLETFYKPRDERSFLGADPAARRESIRSNLEALPPGLMRVDGRQVDIKGTRLLVVDDSVVRGTNAPHAISLLRDVGFGEITLLSYTPKIGIIGGDGTKHGCEYGVDMPPNDRFVVRTADGRRNRSDRAIDKVITAKTLFLSRNGLERAFARAGVPKETLCDFCIGGDRPF